MEEQNTQNTTTEPVEIKEAEPAAGVTNSKPLMSGARMFTVAAVIVGILLIVFALYTQVSKNDSNNEVVEVSKDYPDVVAVVNGEDVGNKDFSVAISRTELSALQQGLNLEDAQLQAEIEAQAMDVLVNTTLLIQAAEAAGITVTDEEVDIRLAALQAQFGSAEAFAAEVEKLGLTEEELRVDIYEDILVTGYLEQSEAYASVDVTDEEVLALYDSYATQGQELPPLEEVSDAIRQQLLLEQQQAAVSVIIEGLRTQAEIEVLI